MLVMTVIGYFAVALAINIVMRVYLSAISGPGAGDRSTVHDIGAAADVAARVSWPARSVKALPMGSMSQDSRCRVM